MISNDILFWHLLSLSYVYPAYWYTNMTLTHVLCQNYMIWVDPEYD